MIFFSEYLSKHSIFCLKIYSFEISSVRSTRVQILKEGIFYDYLPWYECAEHMSADLGFLAGNNTLCTYWVACKQGGPLSKVDKVSITISDKSRKWICEAVGKSYISSFSPFLLAIRAKIWQKENERLSILKEKWQLAPRKLFSRWHPKWTSKVLFFIWIRCKSELCTVMQITQRCS